MRARILKWLFPDLAAELEKARRSNIRLAELEAEQKAGYYRPRRRPYQVIGDDESVVDYVRCDPWKPQ